MRLVVHSIAVLSAVQMSDVTQYVDATYNYRIPITKDNAVLCTERIETQQWSIYITQTQ